jgi:ABC-2 type transport system ATP-binding protein
MSDRIFSRAGREPGEGRRVAAVRARGLSKRYGAVHAVRGVDLEIDPGEVVALLGPNGAGKSTTVDMITGLTGPDAGTVEIFGRSPRQAVRDGVIGAMLQEGALLDNATVGETVAMVASLHASSTTVVSGPPLPM